MNISSIKNLASRCADRTIGFANRVSSKAMDSKVAHTLMPENPTDIAKLLALISTTTKDIVNCYYYTTQSYNNKKIPEDNRKFVACIDLANGILNVITQLTLGLCINKWSDKLYERIFKGGFVPTKEKIDDYTHRVNQFLKKSVLTENQIEIQESSNANNKSELDEIKNENDYVLSYYRGLPVIAKLEIPKINLITDVLKDYSEDNLKISVTKFYKGLPNEEGNFCIA